MIHLLDKYVLKLVEQGLAAPSEITFLGLDAALYAAGERGGNDELAGVFDLMNINSLLFAEPAEPYRTLMRGLTAGGAGLLVPSDCETRTFLHDIPVIDDMDPLSVSKVLSRRKAAIVRGRGIVTYGTVSPEQAFVSFSSVCFATFVKYFSDLLFSPDCGKADLADPARLEELEEATAPVTGGTVRPYTPEDESGVYEAIAEAGKMLVRHRLVDSYFGNISCVFGDRIFISQTGSSMDELESYIDAVPLDGSSSAGITASSELSAHLGIWRETGKRAILHGHPKFTVIMSMSCRREGCDLSTCYRSCRIPREVLGFPVVSGEIGTGPTGLAGTVPAAMKGSEAVLVYGHGVFAAGDRSFRRPFDLMHSLEERCRQAYFARAKELVYRLRA